MSGRDKGRQCFELETEGYGNEGMLKGMKSRTRRDDVIEDEIAAMRRYTNDT